MSADANIAAPQGVEWADGVVETHGRHWLDTIDLGPATPTWEVFKLCYSLGAGATDDEVIEALFEDEDTAFGVTYRLPEEFVSAFVDAAIERLREWKSKSR